MAAAATGVAIATTISIFVTDKARASGFVPQHTVDASFARTNAALALIFSSPISASCPATFLVQGPANWIVSARTSYRNPLAHPLQTDCAYTMSCAACSLFDPASFLVSFPPWFPVGSWTLGVVGATLENGTRPLSIVSGSWSPPDVATLLLPDVSISTAPEVIVAGAAVRNASGYAAALFSVTTSPGSANEQVAIFRLVPSGQIYLTNISEPSLVAGLSTILGGLTGVLGVFRLILGTSEGISHQISARHDDNSAPPREPRVAVWSPLASASSDSAPHHRKPANNAATVDTELIALDVASRTA
jgi:hypothetical protein